MKKLVLSIAVLISLSAQAQKNTLLDASFWQSKPGVNQVKAEVEKGNSPSQLNPASFDATVMAINNDASLEVIKYLLAQPGNEVNKLTHDTRRYLHWASSRGNVEVMEILIVKGAELNIPDSHGLTPLGFAATSAQQNTKVYNLLVSKGVNLKKTVNNDGANPLLLAIGADKDLKLTDYFISKGLDIKSTDNEGNNTFVYVARGGNIETLKTLLKRGVGASDKAFLAAAQGGRRKSNTIEVYQYLETLNLKPTVIGKNGENALHYVVGKPEQLEIVKYFIAKGVDVNKVDNEGNSVFMRAAATGEKDVLELLLPSIKNINQVNNNGLSAISFAVRSNTPEIVSYLISKGADLNVVDRSGENLAAYLLQSYSPRNAKNFGEKLEIIKAKGFNLEQPQKNGNTLYHLAVVKNDISLLKSLESLNIDVNAKNADGITALHKSAMVSKDDAILKYLLARGAKKDAVTGFEETAYDLASENELFTKNNISVNFLK